MSTAHPVYYKRWDRKTGSPRKLWRAINDFLTDNRYHYRDPEYEDLKFDPSSIEGTAIFSRSTKSWRDKQRPLNIWLFLSGVLLCLTIIFIERGLKRIEKSRAPVRFKVEIAIEGEVYRARGSGSDGISTSEVLDVVADTRIVLNGWVGRAIKGTWGKLDPTDRNARETESFANEWEELRRKFDDLLPQITLAKVITGDKSLKLSSGSVCARCKNPISDDWKKCPICGEPLLEVVGYRCSECGSKIEINWKACPHCGISLTESK